MKTKNMLSVLAIAFIIWVIMDAKEKAHEMPDTYEEKRTWVKMKKGNKEYWVIKNPME